MGWRRDRLATLVFLGFRCGSAGKESAGNAGDLGSISGLGRSPREGKGYPLQYSSLENSMDYIVHGVTKIGHDWVTFTSLQVTDYRDYCIVHGVAKSGTQLNDFYFTWYILYKFQVYKSDSQFLRFHSIYSYYKTFAVFHMLYNISL